MYQLSGVQRSTSTESMYVCMYFLKYNICSANVFWQNSKCAHTHIFMSHIKIYMYVFNLVLRSI
jgi:hypothetical protein